MLKEVHNSSLVLIFVQELISDIVVYKCSLIVGFMIDNKYLH